MWSANGISSPHSSNELRVRHVQHAAPIPNLSHLIVPVNNRFTRTTLGWRAFRPDVTSAHFQPPDLPIPHKSHRNVGNTQDRPSVPTFPRHTMVAIDITNSRLGYQFRTPYQAVFALDIVTAVGALVLLILATRPTFKRIKARRFISPSTSSSRNAPLKTTLRTYLSP